MSRKILYAKSIFSGFSMQILLVMFFHLNVKRKVWLSDGAWQSGCKRYYAYNQAVFNFTICLLESTFSSSVLIVFMSSSPE